jgi:tetratricopeptide (TPR) repeat protein
MTVRFASGVLLLLASAASSIPAVAQIPEKFENLQVLPKDIPRAELTQIMRGFTFALGVRCEFCHVPREGQAAGGGGGGGGLNLNFASDERDNKKTARHMLRMVDSINTRFLASIPNRDDPPTNITCVTCHRGVMKPTTIDAVLTRTTERAGVDSAIARYRMLRNDMAAGRYDFREQAVNEVAQRFSAAGKHDDAIKLLQMNQEFYPNSVAIDFQLAETYLAKGDRDAGIARLRAVLAKNPNDRRAAARLQQLGVQP